MNRKLIQNKRTIMCFSALQIILFHLWIQIFRGNQIEQFLVKTAYIGVDVFFFLSAYSLASRKITDWKAYFLSRMEAVYLKFVCFSLVGAVVAGWSVEKFFETVAGIELFQRGGGSFLWFLPAIMLFYLCFPFLQRGFEKRPWLGAVLALILWFGVGLAVSKGTKYTAFYIFWNRIPVFVLGALAAAYEESLTKLSGGKRGTIWRVSLGILFCALGTILLWKYGFRSKLAIPFADMYYIMAIPAVIGIVLLVDYIPSVSVIAWAGGATLELYALQMIFGFSLANKVYKVTQNAMLTNLCSIALITAVAIGISKLYGMIRKGLTKDGR